MTFHRELLDYSALHGRWTYLEFDTDDPESATIVDEFDPAVVQQTLDRNQQLRSAGRGKGDWGYLAASVPAAVQELWRQQHGIDHDNPDHADGVKRLLNDSDYKKLRIYEGHL